VSLTPSKPEHVSLRNLFFAKNTLTFCHVLTTVRGEKTYFDHRQRQTQI